MEIRKLNIAEINSALPLVWRVFCEYEAVNYSENGKQAFWDAVHSEEYLNMITAYGAYNGNELLGIIATRNEGKHLAMFFVDGAHHKKGIGRSLWKAMLADNTADSITVHSSLYAVDIYKRLGFVQTGPVSIENGIKYLPMVFSR